MTCALGQAQPWTGRAQGPKPRPPFLIALFAGAEFKFWDSCAQNKTSEISKIALSRILGLLCTEQDVGNFKKCTFKYFGTPVRRTRRRKSQKIHFQEFWDSCAQNKASEIPQMWLSGILGLPHAEQNDINIKKCTFRKYGTLVRRTKRRNIKIILSYNMGLLCAEQNIGNLNKTAPSRILGLLGAEQHV